MPSRSITTPATFMSVLAFALTAGAQQQSLGNTEARSILREASALIPQVEPIQQSSASANIAGRQVLAGDIEGALATYGAQTKSANDGVALDVVASMMTSKGDLPFALDLVRTADSSLQPSAYAAITIHLALKDDFDNALATAHLIRGEGQTALFVDSLMWINLHQQMAGDLPGAQATLNEALDAVEREKNRTGAIPFAIAAMFQNIASRLVEGGNREGALAVIERISGVIASTDDTGQKEQLMGMLSRAQANAGQFDTALGTAQQIPPSPERDTAMETIAVERTRQGDTAGALNEAAAVDGDYLRNTSYRVVADALAGAGQDARALSVIDLIEGPGERANGLAELAFRQAGNGDPQAWATVQLASEAALNAGDNVEPHVFELIAVARGSLKDFSAAEEIIGRLKDPDKVWPLWTITEQLAAAGRESEAISLAESQSAPYPKVYALLGTASALIESQQADAAKSTNAGK